MKLAIPQKVLSPRVSRRSSCLRPVSQCVGSDIAPMQIRPIHRLGPIPTSPTVLLNLRRLSSYSTRPNTTNRTSVYKCSRSPTQHGQFRPERSFSSTIKMAASTKYPSREEIEKRFEHMANGEYAKFFEHVAEDVDWTVMGTHPCAGHYKSLSSFYEHTLKRLGAIMKDPGIKLKVRNVIGGGDQEWAVAELIADAECKNGLNFDNTYAWCLRHNEEGKVVQVRAYLDSTLVKQAVEENESPSHRAPTGG